MINKKAKIGFIIVLFNTPEEEMKRLRLEIINLEIDNYKIYFIDNSETGKGYAEGVNEGLKKAIKQKCSLFVIANPDISLVGITKEDLLAGGEVFDIWGLVMKQENKIFYGGKIDSWRMSGGLTTERPKKRFLEVDFISGSLMIIKKKVMENIGYLAEDYFMYYEDVDYCYRAGKSGLKVGIDSGTAYLHFEESKNNQEKEKYLAKSKKLFFNKYANLQQRLYEIARTPKTVIEKLVRLNLFQQLFSRMQVLNPASQRGEQVQDDKKPNAFFVNFASLNISSLIIKLLNFVLFIFLIKYLAPEEYGIYTLVWAQIALFSPIVDLGTTAYGIVNLPAEKKDKFVSLFNLRLLVAILVFFLTVLSGFILFRGNARVTLYILLTSFVIFSNLFSGSYLINNAVSGKLYNSSFVSGIFNTILIITLISFTLLFKSLPVIFLLTFILYNLYSFINYFLIKKDFADLNFKFDLPVWKKFLNKSYVYILIGFLASLYFKTDIYLLQLIKGENSVGIYSAGYKFFEGLMFVAASYNIARTPMLVKLALEGVPKMLVTVKKDFLLMSALGSIIALISYFFSPYLLPYFLKGNYEGSITVVRIVMFTFPFILMSSVLINTIYVLNKAKLIIYLFLFQSVVNIVLNLIFIPKYSYIASSYITVISELLNVFMLLLILKFILKKHV